MSDTRIRLCASKGCSNPRLKGRTLCNLCKAAREDMVKVICANDGCKHIAAIDSHLCRFCRNREAAMAESHKPNTSGKKRCCHCKDVRPVICFNVNRGNSDGLDSTCKACRSEQKAAKHHGDKKGDEGGIVPHCGFEHFGGNRLSALLSKPMGAIAQQLSGE